MGQLSWMPKAMVCVGIVGGLGLVNIAPVSAADLLPHRAVYDMKLANTGASSSIESITGRLVFELTGSPCEGFVINTRLVLNTLIGEGRTVLNDYQSSTFEDHIEREFRFLSKDFVNQTLNEEIKGVASAEESSIEVMLDLPEEKSARVDGEALFPVEHMMGLISAAEADLNIYQALLFDGTDGGEKVYNTTAIIGAKSIGVGDLETITPADDLMPDGASWPIVMSYFDDTSENAVEGLPIYEISFRLFDNAVTREILLDYGQFQIEGQMTDIEVYEVVPCEE